MVGKLISPMHAIRICRRQRNPGDGTGCLSMLPFFLQCSRRLLYIVNRQPKAVPITDCDTVTPNYATVTDTSITLSRSQYSSYHCTVSYCTNAHIYYASLATSWIIILFPVHVAVRLPDLTVSLISIPFNFPLVEFFFKEIVFSLSASLNSPVGCSTDGETKSR